MKRTFLALLFLLMITCVFSACSESEKNDIIFEEINPGESCSLPEDVSETRAPDFEDFDSIYIFEGDSSPLILMTDKERAEFLEIIGAYKKEPAEEIDPAIGIMDRSIIFKSGENGAVLYSKELAGKGLLALKWDKGQNTAVYNVSGDIFYDLADLQNRIRKNAREDGRWPFLFPEEDTFSYSDYPPEFDEEQFLKELDIFVYCIPGTYDIETDRLGPERAGLYCRVKVLRDYNAKEKPLLSDEHGQALVPEAEMNRTAKYVFGISEYSYYNPSENGYYTVPFDLRILKYKVTDIETDGAYVFCTVVFTDPDDVNFEWEPRAKKIFCFTRFEAEGETWYRPVSARYEFGEEYGF